MTEIMKPGYKLTEVGVIPEEWDAATIGEISSFSGGSQPPRSTFRFSPSKDFIRLVQIRDYKTDEYASYIPEVFARKFCTVDDIMIGRYGPPIFQILRGIAGAYNVALIKAIPNQKVDHEYLFYILKQDSLFQLIESLSRRSSGQTGVELPALKAYVVPLPPLTEQHIISQALSDVDALINLQDQLIAKKRDIKQAAMQQLLTGQKRLPGYYKDWDEKRLGDISQMGSGGTPLSSTPAFFSGNIPWVSIADMTKSGKVIASTDKCLTPLGLANSAAQMFPAGTVLYAMYASLGECCIAGIQVCTSQAILGIRPTDQLNNEFLYYYLKFIKEKVKSLGQQGTQSNLNKSMVQDFCLHLPSYEEQTGIATFLSDMDKELLLLETRRNKTTLLKQAMMQELLTGRIRLV